MMPNSNAQKRRKKYKTNSNYVQVRRVRHMLCVLGSGMVAVGTSSL
jgi:hypothetical protein